MLKLRSKKSHVYTYICLEAENIELQNREFCAKYNNFVNSDV